MSSLENGPNLVSSREIGLPKTMYVGRATEMITKQRLNLAKKMLTNSVSVFLKFFTLAFIYKDLNRL
jgi:hypothetical protein